MNRLTTSLGNKLLAGILAAIPIGAVIYGVYWLEVNTQPFARWLGFPYPGVGILLALVAVYLLGFLVTSLIGRWLMTLGDRALGRIPGLRLLYQSWKEVMVEPADRPGMFHRVVLVPSPEGQTQLGFTNGVGLPGDPQTLCVFVPGVPNPVSGRLLLVPQRACVPLELPREEAFKFLLSTGNYQPAGLRAASPATIEGAR
jgi:uncharacterized membrane protein